MKKALEISIKAILISSAAAGCFKLSHLNAGGKSYYNFFTRTLHLQGDVVRRTFARACYEDAEFEYDYNAASLPKFCSMGSLKHVVAENGARLPKNCKGLFSGFYNLKTVDLEKADTSDVSNISLMFEGCTYLESVDLNGMDTSNVTDMSYMFSNCYSLKTLDLRYIDTSAADLNNIFAGCSHLQKVKVGSSSKNVSSETKKIEFCTSD